MVERLVRIPERDHHFTTWFMLSFAMATTIAAIIVAAGNPIGASLASHLLNVGMMIVINALLFSIWTIIVGALFSFIYLPIPRLFLASLSYTFISTVVILNVANSGTLFSFMIGIIYSLLALCIGFLFIVLFHRNIGKVTKGAILTILLISGASYLLFDQLDLNTRDIPAIADHIDTIIDQNPANRGNYDYRFFTYGSGHDLHREKFGPSVDQVTPTVDASDFITKWGKKREGFWGFNPSELPINGRVWQPEGEGPFPVILMVHGNHTMEYFSTSGYDYLGKLLASRGFITISVDQDFINYSNRFGSPNRNYELRAWMMLQHLVHLQNMNETANHPLYEKIDFQQVALVGHSRGGQAVHMAADYTTFFDDEDLLSSMENVEIKAVVGIAPTDKTVDKKRSNIHNTSYLLLHGARDADVSSFRDRPFYRTTFDADYDGFKASLYIEDANHTHFNADWGSMDLSFPRGIFLNQKQTLDPEDQQQIAKVYLSAFFETVFQGHGSYEKLFQDHRYGKDWLPDTTLINKYRHASYQSMTTYHQNDVEIIDTDGLTNWEITRPNDRDDNQRPLHALQLEWDNDASYTFDLPNDDLSVDDHIVFTMANINDNPDNESIPEIELELETIDGISVRRSLHDFMPFPPVISTDYTRFGLFDNSFRDAKYKNSWEPTFQTFEVPIKTFAKINPDFRPENIHTITMHFKSHPGKILIEEVGVW